MEEIVCSARSQLSLQQRRSTHTLFSVKDKREQANHVNPNKNSSRPRIHSYPKLRQCIWDEQDVV